jgi:uncharacterized protein (TIGR03545 family)
VRWNYIIPRLTIVLLLCAFRMWGMDPLLRYSAVQTLQMMIGARADIGQLETQIYPPRITVTNVALADAKRPGQNLLQFDELEFRLSGEPLLRRQFVVDEGRLTGLKFRTARADDGQLETSPAADEETPPSWIEEKLRSAGDEWLTGLTEELKSQVDPDVLETYRTGTAVYDKWDERFREMSDRTRLLEPRFKELKLAFENARHGDALHQIEQYLQVAQRAEMLAQEAQEMKTELTGIVPEVRTDFASLDQARRNDQTMIQNRIALLKPDARRITETLIGEQMYLQVQHLLSWVETAQQYRQQLREQVKPPRSTGQEFAFPVRNPTPDFVVLKLAVSGEVQVDGKPVPFQAQLSDATEDAPLLGRPCVLRVRMDGDKPLQLKITRDATGPETVSEIAALYRDVHGQTLTVGRPDKAMLSGRLSDITWDTQLTLKAQQLSGTISLSSAFSDSVVAADDSIRPELLEAANDAIQQVAKVDATLHLSGTMLKPEMQLESSVGEQIADGIQLAFSHQVQNAKQRLLKEVNTFASDQVERLSARFAGEYDKLISENAELIKQIRQVQTLVASLQSGDMDAATLVRQVKNSRVLPAKQQQQVDRTINDVNQVLKTTRLPESLKGAKLPLGRLTKPGQAPQER